MKARYESFQLPRAAVVHDRQTKTIVAAYNGDDRAYQKARADAHADALNRWEGARPEPTDIGLFLPAESAEPSEATLLALVARISEPERRLDQLEATLAEMVAAG